MKNIKKALLAFLVLSFVFIAGGCTLNGDDDNNNEDATTTTAIDNDNNNDDNDIGDDIKNGVDNVEDSLETTTK